MRAALAARDSTAGQHAPPSPHKCYLSGRTAGPLPTYLRNVDATTAILLFSRTAAAEARAKAFGPRGQRVAAALLGRTERTLARTGLPVYRSSEQQQRGTDFGSKLTAAVGEVLANGYRNVIIVGNDCPTLSVGGIRQALEALEAGRSVIGPDVRGGVWLLGLRAEDFRAKQLTALPWQTAALAQALETTLPDPIRLTVRRDYNRLGELRAQAFHLRPRLPELLVLLAIPSIPTTPPIHYPSCVAHNALTLRGPPLG